MGLHRGDSCVEVFSPVTCALGSEDAGTYSKRLSGHYRLFVRLILRQTHAHSASITYCVVAVSVVHLALSPFFPLPDPESLYALVPS